MRRAGVLRDGHHKIVDPNNFFIRPSPIIALQELNDAVGDRGLSNDRLFAAPTAIIIIIWAAAAVVKAKGINFLLSIDPTAQRSIRSAR